MRTIDMQNWPRREHFKAYNASPNPHFSITTNMDVTAWYPAVKSHAASYTVAMMYAISRAANAVPELRCRIRGDAVVEHEVVHPSTTILGEDESFRFCTVEYNPDFPDFAGRSAERIAYVRQHLTLKDDPGRDDFLFMTAIPWVSFTSFTHPGHLNPADSIPLFAWGKRFEEDARIQMPLEITVHHAVVDGLHVGRFYEQIQAIFLQPELVFGDRTDGG